MKNYWLDRIKDREIIAACVAADDDCWIPFQQEVYAKSETPVDQPPVLAFDASSDSPACAKKWKRVEILHAPCVGFFHDEPAGEWIGIDPGQGEEWESESFTVTWTPDYDIDR